MKKILKKIANIIIVLIVLIILIHLIHALTFDNVIKYNNYVIRLEENNKELDGYKITFLSDTHEIKKEKLWDVVDYINRNIHPDIVVLGGDYFPNAVDDEVFKITSNIKTKDGIYAVEGNHDNYDYIQKLMEKENIHFLDNSGKSFKNGLYIAGVRDLYSGKANISQSVLGAKEDDFVFLVSHNPDISMEQSMEKVDFTVAGHTHGGQITFLGIWTPTLPFVSNYNQRFKSGLCKNENNDQVYVSKGVGEYSSLPRIFAQPEVITFEFIF